jgi:hypothetical protein
MIDLVITGGAVFIFLSPLLVGYFLFSSSSRHRRLCKKLPVGIAGLQLAVLLYFGWIFGTSERHVNHSKWIAPLIFVDVLMWVCFSIGIGLAVLRSRIKARYRQ